MTRDRAPSWPARLSSLVKLPHTVFGLPFCLAAAAIAHGRAVQAGQPGIDLRTIALVVVAFSCARTAAMAFNRIVDRRIDGDNPRTASREIPRGLVSVRAAAWLTALSAGGFVAAAVALGPLPGALSPIALALVLGYSALKRVTWACHLVLGACLALAPAGAWLAVTGGFSPAAIVVPLSVAVASWVAGFDVLYSLADEAFDRGRGLHSIPVRLGIRGALVVSALLHGITAACLVALHVAAGLHAPHLVGVAVMAALLAWQHVVVRPGDLSRLDAAFFAANGWASIAYLAAVLLDLALA